MKELKVILDPYEIGDKLNELLPGIQILSRIIKENPALASIEISKIRHHTIGDLINRLFKNVNDIVSMVDKGKTHDY